MKNIEFLEAVCWDYNINAKDVYTILKTKKDDDFPISFDVLRKKILKYVSISKLQEIFTLEELKNIFSGINPNTIRNPETRDFYLKRIELYLHDPNLKLIEKANKLIKQTEKEALEIIKKREFIKSKIVDNSIAIDFIINCLTKKRYDDLTYNERLFVNDIFENATKEDLQVLKDKYFIDLEDLKELNQTF